MTNNREQREKIWNKLKNICTNYCYRDGTPILKDELTTLQSNKFYNIRRLLEVGIVKKINRNVD